MSAPFAPPSRPPLPAQCKMNLLLQRVDLAQSLHNHVPFLFHLLAHFLVTPKDVSHNAFTCSPIRQPRRITSQVNTEETPKSYKKSEKKFISAGASERCSAGAVCYCARTRYMAPWVVAELFVSVRIEPFPGTGVSEVQLGSVTALLYSSA